LAQLANETTKKLKATNFNNPFFIILKINLKVINIFQFLKYTI